jgi:hypothetical protein
VPVAACLVEGSDVFAAGVSLGASPPPHEMKNTHSAATAARRCHWFFHRCWTMTAS